MIVIRRRAILLMASTALLGACTSDSPSPVMPLAPSASVFQLQSTGATIQASNTWTTVANMPFPRAYTVTAVANGKLYTIGGADTKFSYNTVTEYNPTTNSWATKAPLPKKISSQLGATTIGSLIYVPGGWDGIQYLNLLLTYDPVANVWKKKAPMPVPGACGGSAEINGLLYVAIGCDNGGFANKLLRYNPTTDSWTQLPNAPGTHSGGAVTTMNNKLYWNNGTVGTGVDVYNPATNSWSSGPRNLVPRILSSFGSINGVLISAGGYTVGTVINSVEYMDDKANLWAPRSNMVAQIGAASSVVLNGEWYVVGGNGPGSINTVSTVQKYTPGDYWLTLSSLSAARGFAAAATDNNAVFAIGGRLQSSTTPVATNEVYTPSTGTWTTVAPIPTAVWGAAAAGVGGKIYVIGGFTGDTATSASDKVWEYSAASNNWTQLGNAPTPIGFASAAVVLGKIYVAVGTDGTNFNSKKVYRYDPATDTWTIGQNSPGAHSQGVAAGIGTYFVTIGGGAGASGKALDAFSVPANSWVTGPDALWSMVGASGGAIGTNVYVAHGSNGGTFTAATSRFDGIAKSWASRTASPEALAFTASAVTNGNLLTAGGIRQNGTATNAARVYVP